MKREPLYDYLRRRLGETIGMHSRIAREAGVPQATVSRIFRGQAMPRLDNADALLAWYEKYDHDRSVARVARRRVGRDADATAPLGQ